MLFKKGKKEDEILSLLGKGAEMTGEISFTNGLRVEGIIKGKVRSEAILEIGP
jgi:cytoskeletal protein CcmA (bactofilin family)